MDKLVGYAVDGHLARLTLDSPHNRNALSGTLVGQLHQGLRAAAADPAVRAVVLSHTGGTFCAGADLSEASGGDPRGDRERGVAGRSGSPPSGIRQPFQRQPVLVAVVILVEHRDEVPVVLGGVGEQRHRRA